MKRIYLDHAAATPVSPAVRKAMQPYFSDVFYNPSALYEGARQARAALETARSSVARSIGARPSEVIFMAGGTESANTAIHGVMSRHRDGECIISAIEHDAVDRPAETYTTKLAPVSEKGIVDVPALLNLITDKTVLISVMLVNNEVGTIQPLSQVTEAVANIKQQRKKAGNTRPLFVHTDACQAPLYLDCNVARLGVDLMTLNGGKMHGPKQSGMLYVKTGTQITPLVRGGGQEMGLRSGTENVAFAVGFAHALKAAESGRQVRVKKVAQLRDTFIKKLSDQYDAEVLGDRKQRIANNVYVLFPDSDNERMLFALDDLGVDAAAGSACSASSETASRVLLAMGRTDVEAQSSIRFTLGVDTTEKELDTVLMLLKDALKA